jgi:hypothetical protein
MDRYMNPLPLSIVCVRIIDMHQRAPAKQLAVLFFGDCITLGLVTILGFASHGTASTAGGRMLTTLVPLLISWLLLAPHLGAFDLARIADLRQLWRPFWAMVLAGPMAAWMRGVWLNAPILPVFVVVLGGISALGLLAWRALYALVISRKS